MTFAMLDFFSQEIFTDTNLMRRINISGIQTSINIKTIIGHKKDHTSLKVCQYQRQQDQNSTQDRWKYHQHFQRKKSQWTPLKLQLLRSSRNGIGFFKAAWNSAKIKTQRISSNR